MNEWQKGFPIERLKALAFPFRQMHKQHCYGAFGLTKERDLATALEKKRCAWIRQGEGYGAVAVWQVMGKRGKKITDFRGRCFYTPNKSLYISAFAALGLEQGLELLTQFLVATKQRFYVEIFEEDRTAREVVEALGLKWYATKISAGSEIKGVYSLRGGEELPPEEAATLEEMQRPYLTSSEMDGIRGGLAEHEAHLWAQHYSSYNKRQSWTAFALRGYDENDPSFIIKPAEMSKAWRAENSMYKNATSQWTGAARLFPKAVEIARRFVSDDSQIDRLRFMRLSAQKGELARHADITDREAGVQDGRIARLHIPIHSSDKVTLYGWTHRGEIIERKFKEGGLYYLDQRKPHRVINEGGQERVHLVLDVRSSEKVRELLRA